MSPPVSFCGLELGHPLVNGSGTFDAIAARRVFGEAIATAFPFAAFVSKTITLEPRHGNPPPRLYETAGGLINSIGLPNKGLQGYLEQDLPALDWLPVPLITNVMGSTAAEVSVLVEAVEARPEVSAIELNVSCPLTAKPLVVKLTPNTADVSLVAQAAEAAGADAVSLINTLRAFAPSPGGAGGPWLGGGTGGLSGPAVRTVALAQVRAVAARVSIPIVGMGGVSSGRHAQDLLEAGATLVGVGTESFRDPLATDRIRRQLQEIAANGPVSAR